jgi:sugar O-acyltransferase (sialic acid O-acetyltransferase NeuD family)
MFIAGTRTFAAEVLGYAQDAGIEVTALLEPYEREKVGGRVHDLEVVWLEDAPAGADVVIGTGDRERASLVTRVEAVGLRPVALVSPAAHLARSATVDAGAIVAPGVVVGAFAAIGAHTVLGRGTLVGHHTAIEPFATLGPGVNIAGNARIGRAAFVGMSAAVRDHVTVGAGATIAMGSIVIRDVPDGESFGGFTKR